MPTYQLDLVGATTINLAGSPQRLIEYQPRSASLTDSMRARLFTGSRDLYDEPTVIESARVILTGTQAVIQATFQSIQHMLRVVAPRRYQTRSGQRVFLVWLADGLTGANRGEILYGSVEYASKQSMQFGWAKWGQVEVIIVWKRRLFEKNSETAIPLTNGNGTDTTAGLNVYSCNDGTGVSPNKLNNYVEIKAADVIGVLPAPVRLELSNTYGTALRRIYVAHKAQGTATSFAHVLECEAATLNATYCVDTLTASTSGGHTVVTTNVPAAATTLMTWTITATQAGYALSQWIRTLIRFSTLPSNSTIYVRLILQDSGSTAILAQTDWQLLNNTDYLQPLPTLELSPNLQGQTTPGAMKLVLQAKDAAAVGDFSADFIQLSPVEMATGFRWLKPIDETLVTVAATTGVLTDNMIDGGLYTESVQGVYRSYGGPIMLLPGVLQRIYLLMDGASDAAIARLLSVKAYYRPRVETV